MNREEPRRPPNDGPSAQPLGESVEVRVEVEGGELDLPLPGEPGGVVGVVAYRAEGKEVEAGCPRAATGNAQSFAIAALSMSQRLAPVAS